MVIAVYVLAGAGLLVVLVGAIILLITGIKTALFFGGEEGQQMIEGIKETVEIAQAAQHAPGTDELRAAGCDTASVMDLGEMMGAVSNFAGEEDQEELEALSEKEMTMISCQVSFGDDPPLECDEIARVYGAAVPDAPDEIMVQSQKAGRIKDHCAGIYQPDGTYVGPLDASTFEPPAPPTAPAKPEPASQQ